MNIKKIISSVIVGAGAIAVGLGLQYAAASWTAAPTTPPNSNASAPLNVDGGTAGNIYTQTKSGLLALANLVVTNMNVASGTVNTAGSVLTNDGSGNASWGSSAAGGVPSGAIMAFDLTACPTGWTEYTAARGRAIIGSGPASTSTSARIRGSTGGAETHTLTVSELPHFTVTMSLPIGGNPQNSSGCCNSTPGSNSASFTSPSIGGGQAHSIMPPFVAQLYCRKN